MKTYIINWKAKTPLATKLESDTIFGHICWSYRYLKGEKKLEDLLDRLGHKPGLVLSNGFPKCKLPMPVQSRFSSLLEQSKTSILVNYKISAKDWYEEMKNFLRVDYIERDSLIGHDKLFSVKQLLTAHWDKFENNRQENQDEDGFSDLEEVSVIHNSINRLTGTTAKGGANMFADLVTFHKENYEYQSYLDTDLLSEEDLREIFGYIQMNGYGRNKNTGLGRFDIEVKQFGWESNPDSNAHLVLSNMVPDSGDSTDCFSKSDTKHGKLGGNFAVSESPFKFPIHYFKPGTVFLSKEKPLGTLVKGIHPDRKDLVQNLYAYSVPILIKE